ncbi:helix-turn-helix transcriptional regulator [Nitratireductor aquimarinus]|uniref:Helix-turn-helix transcriptional regulator n=1 Tax=Nitratireductor aquimarinus TaxID=889300 RepID=A0ABU4AMS6_9HYPH|nr:MULTISPECIES: helix-turn-helix transcriptional regulator [Nitratireductor]MDJ1464654.1 helix-turn-helix transcriptional regulator [Nitratireductor sp. GZWM139]MDV2965708.1 helix-turn-helix transcriptional regulator [Nitratireductor aquimarinus]MDV6227551.1 helix-turn-helix transcriptional regulator [Nitratireductor aquimarinus]
MIRFSDIGARLRAYRLGKGLAPDELAEKLGISRAALYRAEKGEIRKIEMLTSIADELGVSLPSLMGVGVEYVSSAIAFFERMRQLEDDCQQVIGLFSPVSYLLTSDAYDDALQEVLRESVPPEVDPEGRSGEVVDALIDILRARKKAFRLRRPLIVSLIASADLEGFLLHGLIGRHDLPPDVVNKRRLQARREAEYILTMLREQPIGIQIGIVREPVPATSFQIFRQQDRSVLAISPFRLGEQPNIRVGVALITSAPEAMTLHEDIAEGLWADALKGDEAASYLETMIEKYAIPVDA